MIKQTVDLLAKLGLGEYRTIQKVYVLMKSYLKSDFAEINGHKMFLDKEDTLSLSIRGVWEKFETECIKKILTKEMVVIDLGANIGYYTLIFAKLVGPQGKIFAFEPEPNNFDLLKKKTLINGYQNVVLEQKAISNKNERLKLYLDKKNLGAHKLFFTHADQKFIEVDVITLDDYFNNYDGNIDFIKMDVEGSEILIIEGMSNLLKKNTNIIMMVEFAPILIKKAGRNPEELLEILTKHDFKLFELNPKKESIMRVNIPELLQRCTTTRQNSTNLLCVKGNLNGNLIKVIS